MHFYFSKIKNFVTFANHNLFHLHFFYLVVIPMNFTGTIRNQEQRVSYFGEDIGMNAHHSHWHMDWPFWWDEAKYGVHKDRKGELFW